MSRSEEMEPVAFETFKKIPRLFRDIVITEKIDGTNAQIYVPDDPAQPVLFGSRNRWVTPGKYTDNYDFARWGAENEAMLRRLGYGRHFGEWFGVGIARRYNLGERRWALFGENKELPEGLPANVCRVPVLYEGPYSMSVVDEVMMKLARDGSVAVPGFKNPEGIVVYHKASGQLFKYTFDGDGVSKKRPSPIEHEVEANAAG